MAHVRIPDVSNDLTVIIYSICHARSSPRRQRQFSHCPIRSPSGWRRRGGCGKQGDRKVDGASVVIKAVFGIINDEHNKLSCSKGNVNEGTLARRFSFSARWLKLPIAKLLVPSHRIRIVRRVRVDAPGNRPVLVNKQSRVPPPPFRVVGLRLRRAQLNGASSYGEPVDARRVGCKSCALSQRRNREIRVNYCFASLSPRKKRIENQHAGGKQGAEC